MKLAKWGSLLGLTAVLAMAFSSVVASQSWTSEIQELVVGDFRVEFQQRMIGNAIVVGDTLVRRYDATTGLLLSETSHWRPDLPSQLPPVISKAEAEARVTEGFVTFSQLLYLPKGSPVFPASTSDPCYVVVSARGVPEAESLVTYSWTVVNAVSGVVLGYALPPPSASRAMSISGPICQKGYTDCSACPKPAICGVCSDTWEAYYRNAQLWLEKIGYDVQAQSWPTETLLESFLGGGNRSVFYELAHGGSGEFESGCSGGTSFVETTARDIQDWMRTSSPLTLAFIGSCGGMCGTGAGTLSDAFRKGLTSGSVTVGYCGMGDSGNIACWLGESLDWQDRFFRELSNGKTAGEAFNSATASCPNCANGNVMRIAGDTSVRLRPEVVDSHLSVVTLTDSSSAEAVCIAATFMQSLEVAIWRGPGTKLESLLWDGNPPGVSVMSDPASITYWSPAWQCTVLETYVLGSDGHLWAWRKHMWPKETGAPDGWLDCGAPPGKSLAGTPSAFFIGILAITPNVVIEGSDGTFYRYSGSWTQIGSPGLRPHSVPSVVAFSEWQFPLSQDYEYIFVVDGGGRLYLNDGRSDVWEDLGPATQDLVTARPAAVASTTEGVSGTRIDVFAVAMDGSLRLCQINGTARSWDTSRPPSSMGGIVSAPGTAVLYPKAGLGEDWGPIGSTQIRAFLWGCPSEETLPCPINRLVAWKEGSSWQWNLQEAPTWWTSKGSPMKLTIPELIVFSGSMIAVVGCAEPTTLPRMSISVNYWDGDNWQWAGLGQI